MSTEAPAASAAVPLERFSYDDQIVRMFVFATVAWGMVAFLVGLYAALELALPALNLGIPQLSFGRIRPLHTNAAIFAFAGNGIFAAIYYSTQRLCKARMWSDRLSRLHFWGWQLIILSAALTLPFGITQSKEYAELEWPIDIAIAVVWAGFFGVNFMMTLVTRRERHLYVALWFYIATIVTVAILHIFNNLVLPAGLFKSYPIYAGVQDAFMQWWYGHNAVAFFLTTPFLGLMYYFLPKAAERPVFSYRLSIIHFWSLVFIYIWAGPHHLHYTALPAWASSLGMLFSLMLWMPSWGGMINGLLTLRGAWHKVTSDPILKFFVVGITFYGMSTFEGPVMSIKSVNALTHYTNWTIGHVHAGALGWNGFMTFGMIYWLAPRLFQAPLFSRRLAEAHFWLATIGIAVYVLAMYAAALTEGGMWRAMDENGQLVYGDFVETVVAVVPMYWLRALGGLMYIVGAGLMSYNLLQTWSARPAVYDEPVYEAPPLARHYDDPPAPKSRLRGHVAGVAHWLDRWQQAAWHRRWEHKPVRFTVYVVIAVSFASLLEIVPTFVIQSNVPTIASVQPYTPLELIGRDVYIAEGCYNCHSQMIRPILAETLRYGEFSKAGEFVYDHPHQWGSRRIGPDLARIGGSRGPDWHIEHFVDPQELKPGSLMPAYAWLLQNEVDLEKLPQKMTVMQHFGVPYSETDIAEGVQQAEAQAAAIAAQIEELTGRKGLEKSEAVALIAYLDRLGRDLSAPPPAEPETEADKIASAQQEVK